MIQFILLIICGFIALEVFSYVVHRYVFHGILWRVHRTHHTPRAHLFEFNDIFSLFFALVSIGLMLFAEKPFINSFSFPVGAGIAIYGGLYFVAHDLFTHRRFLAFKSRNAVLLAVRSAHQKHHQSVEQSGIEPFGLFIFNYKKFKKQSAAKNAENS